MNTRVLPILALPLVLFPGSTTPVRIWRPRQRKLARDVVAGDRLVGVVLSPQELLQDEAPPPKVGYVGCVAKVISARKIPNRQIRLVLEGLERFAIRSYVTSPEPYLVAEVAPHEDFDESPQLLATFAEEVRRYYERYSRASGKIADSVRQRASELPADPSELSMFLPTALNLDEETSQRFLASRSPLMRLRELSALLSPAASAAESSADVHTRSRSNGHGASTH